MPTSHSSVSGMSGLYAFKNKGCLQVKYIGDLKLLFLQKREDREESSNIHLPAMNLVIHQVFPVVQEETSLIIALLMCFNIAAAQCWTPTAPAMSLSDRTWVLNM